MPTEHDLRRKQKVPEPVAVVPQTTTPEEDAVVQREQDLVPHLPESVEDLLAATFGEAGSSGLTELQTRFVRDEVAMVAGQAVEQRLRRYLFQGETDTPSRYARALVQAGGDITQLIPADRRTLAEMQMYLVSELNPLLQQWQTVIKPQLGETDLLETLSYGNVERGQGREQRTVSAIGLLRQLSEAHPEFASLQLEAAVHPQHLVVESPFSADTQDYWKARVDCAELYRATEPNQMIGWRTRHLQIVLEEAAATIPETDPDRARVVAAYETVAKWLDVHAEAMEQPLHIDDSETDHKTFDYFVSRMDFTHGDTNDVIAVLNAAELIKQHNPDLFMRMAGIAPNPLQVEGEAQRSDLFGSAFHMALYRTLQLNHPRFQMINQQVQQLTQLEAQATPLVRLNGEQVRQIASKFQSAALAEEPDKMTVAMIAATLASLIARHPREVALALMVNSVEQDSRTETLERLQKAGAHDFYVMIQGAPEAFLDDPAYIEVVRHRLGYTYGQAVRQHIRIIREWKNYREFNWDIKNALWITVDDGALLSEGFWNYLDEARTYLYNHSYLPRDYRTWHERTQQEVPVITDNLEAKVFQDVSIVLAHHSHISKAQALEWYRNTKGLRGKGIADRPIDPDGKREVFQALAFKMKELDRLKLFNHSSFAVLLGPEASCAFNSLGQYQPSRDTSDVDKALGPAVGGALAQRQLIDKTRREREDARPRGNWVAVDQKLVTELRAAYRFMSTERFVKRYRESLIGLGADYIMELRHEASEADFAELIEQLYFPANTVRLSTNPEQNSGYLDTAAKYPDLILAENPWQLEVYDALEHWINEDPTTRTACRAELDKVAQEFLTRIDLVICDYYDNATGQRTGLKNTPLTIYRDVIAPGVISWRIVGKRGSSLNSGDFEYDAKRREIKKI